jgi:predicted dienelactone hydrolase
MREIAAWTELDEETEAVKLLRWLAMCLVALFILAAVHRARTHLFERGASGTAVQGGAAEQAESGSSGGQSTAPCKTNVGYRVMRIGGRMTAVWYPTTAKPSTYHYSPSFSGMLAQESPATTACGGAVPLVVFSHGDLGCALQSVSFTEELARSGYVVAAPDHADAALCHIAAPARGGGPVQQPVQPKILNPEAWDDRSRTDRRDDVEAVLNELLSDDRFRRVIDAEKIGLAGHSLGGYVVVGIAGGWPSWRDPRIRAVLALSPYVMPFQVKKTLGDVHVPLMYQGGTLDVGITPFLMGPRGAYAAANAPAYFVELRQAGHLAWANCGDEHTTEACLDRVTNARLIAQYGIAFFNRHLKGAAEPMLDKRNQQLAEYLFNPFGVAPADR